MTWVIKQFQKLPSWLRKLMPIIILGGLAFVAGATDILGANVQEIVSKSFKETAQAFLPYIAKFLLVAVAFYCAWLLYSPIMSGFEKVLEKSSASARGKDFAVKAVRLFYWLVVLLIIVTWFASELMGKFVLGFSVFGAALTLSLQGAANDFICGVMMQFSQRVRNGDEIQTIGLDVKGKVTDVGFLSTTVEGPEGTIIVPNREVWGRATKIVKAAPKPRMIIMPPGVKYPEPPKECGPEKKGK